jgi:hypothetical protein
MNTIEIIKSAQQARLVDEDGEPVSLQVSPPLQISEIDAVQDRAGQLLPIELRTLLAFCSGIDGCLDGIDFTGESMSFEQKEIFPNGLPIARDGFGNFWVLDLTLSQSKQPRSSSLVTTLRSFCTRVRTSPLSSRRCSG